MVGMEDTIERVMTEDDASLVELKDRTIAILDLRYSKVVLHVDNPVAVLNEQNDVIGTVVLELHPNRCVVGTFFLNRNTPEVFEIEQKVRNSWPHLVGGERAVVVEGSESVTDLSIGYVQILPFEPED